MVKDSTKSVRRETSSRSCLTSKGETPAAVGVGAGSARLAMVGVATSITLSARSASWWRSVELSVDARTILTFVGRRWRKSSRRKGVVSAVSPRSCCMRLSN